MSGIGVVCVIGTHCRQRSASKAARLASRDPETAKSIFASETAFDVLGYSLNGSKAAERNIIARRLRASAKCAASILSQPATISDAYRDTAAALRTNSHLIRWSNRFAR
jgi:hypothetical protein